LVAYIYIDHKFLSNLETRKKIQEHSNTKITCKTQSAKARYLLLLEARYLLTSIPSLSCASTFFLFSCTSRSLSLPSCWFLFGLAVVSLIVVGLFIVGVNIVGRLSRHTCVLSSLNRTTLVSHRCNNHTSLFFHFLASLAFPLVISLFFSSQ